MQEKNHTGCRKVAGQAIMLAHWAQKVGGDWPPCPIDSAANGLRNQNL